MFTAYSGNPVNETTNQDRNGDGNNNERPRQGIDDLTLPILSPIGDDGIAIRNGIEGNNRILLDGRFQYIWNIQSYEAGLFLEVYNLLNHDNFGTPTGNLRIAWVASAVPPEPPAEISPPISRRRVTKCSKATAIAATAEPRTTSRPRSCPRWATRSCGSS